MKKRDDTALARRSLAEGKIVDFAQRVLYFARARHGTERGIPMRDDILRKK